MKLRIHRGTQEIGGTVIELSTRHTSIFLDLGLPLTDNAAPIDTAALKPDAVFISHPHQDHFGLIDGLDRDIPVYIGELGKNLIDATRLFLGDDLASNSFRFIRNREKIAIGDITITPYLVDHSAVDAYSFLIEADNRRIFYSGDFRAHGRKSVLFDRLVANPPAAIDVLLMEGTMIKRSNSDFPDETTVEEKIVDTIAEQSNISFLLCSSQNIDRLVSSYRACLRTGKQLVVDFYTAWIMEKIADISHNTPNIDWDRVRLYADYHPDQIIKSRMEYFGDFRKKAYASRVTKEELHRHPSHFLVISKMSRFKVMNMYKKLNSPINVIYSQWLGYLNCSDNEYFGAEAISAYRRDPEVNFVYAHTSGHAVLNDLQKFAEAIKPDKLIPIHTEYGALFSDYFHNVAVLDDATTLNV